MIQPWFPVKVPAETTVITAVKHKYLELNLNVLQPPLPFKDLIFRTQSSEHAYVLESLDV